MTALESPHQPMMLPDWIPQGALHYLAHTEMGLPIRALARAAGCHASTILRQIRRIESRRDDPLVDAALRRLGAAHYRDPGTPTSDDKHEKVAMETCKSETVPDELALSREAMRILRRLCETGAVLAVATEMDKAVVVRDTAGGGSTRTAVVASAVAQAMALKDWIAASGTGRIVRYHITAAGRAALAGMLEDPDLAPPKAAGFAEAQTAFEPAAGAFDDQETPQAPSTRSRRMRYSLAESPLSALSRKRDGKGEPFLSEALVHAGERLREDFELAQMGARVTQDWGRFLTSGVQGGKSAPSPGGDAPSAARSRVAGALADLGPGLSDVVLRCCCYLEGLETTEKRLGWSARSGKIVLRIALMRLSRHYDQTIGPGGPMIG